MNNVPKKWQISGDNKLQGGHVCIAFIKSLELHQLDVKFFQSTGRLKKSPFGPFFIKLYRASWKIRIKLTTLG